MKLGPKDSTDHGLDDSFDGSDVWSGHRLLGPTVADHVKLKSNGFRSSKEGNAHHCRVQVHLLVHVEIRPGRVGDASTLDLADDL